MAAAGQADAEGAVKDARQVMLELFRAAQAEDPYAFQMAQQDYVLRHEGGVVERKAFGWSEALVRDLSALQTGEASAALRRRLGNRLQRFLAGTRWEAQQQTLSGLAEGERLEVTLRAQAAELLVLPWELLVLEDSGLHLGAHPQVLLRYEWPGSRSAPDATPGRGYDRALFGWSEAGGGVGLRAHLDALEPLYQEPGRPLDTLPDLRLSGLVARLEEARALGKPHRALHLLCHGVRVDGGVSLSWSGGLVDGPTLAERLAPFADTLRVVVLSACMGGDAGVPGSELGAVAQHLHRAGFQAVVASRTPLSIAGSVRLSVALHRALLSGEGPEAAFLAARVALHSADEAGFDWAALQLFARPGDSNPALTGLAAMRSLAQGVGDGGELFERGLDGLGRLPDVLSAPDPGLARRHAALVTAAFLQALLAQLKGDPAAYQDGVDDLLRRAGLELVRAREGDDRAMSERLGALTGSPLHTPYYRAMLTALVAPDGPPLPVKDLVALERGFLSAYRRQLSGEAGESVRRYLSELSAERGGLVRRLVVSELASWGGRHVLDNRRLEELSPGDSSGAMSLDAMLVPPMIRAGGVTRGEPEPALEVLDRRLKAWSRERVVLLRGPFGAGKSVIARHVASQWARRYLGGADGARWLPVFISASEDLDPTGLAQGDLLDHARRRAWRRQLSQLVTDLRLDSPALALPAGEERQVWIIDGLDEWSVESKRVEPLLRMLLDEASDSLSFVVLCRPGVPIEPRLKERLAIFDVEPFGVERGGDAATWLARYGALTGAAVPSTQALRRAKLLDVAQTPGLLFSLAQMGEELSERHGVPLLERSLRMLARGKLTEGGGAAHRRLHAASVALLERLRAHEELPHDADLSEAMLWLMSRTAWELKRCAQRGQRLSLAQLEDLLRQELGFRDADDIELILGGLLLALQASPALEPDHILFGHEPFLHHLVARYWASCLRGATLGSRGASERFTKALLGGRLMADDGAAWRVLMEIVGGDHDEPGLGPLFAWSRKGRRALAGWAEATFADESLVTDGRFRDDQRAYLREAALAVRCSLPDVPPYMLDEDALRSLLAWFWVRQEPSMVVARRCDLSEFKLKGVPLGGADLRETSCRDAELGMAELSFAKLHGANLSGAKLTGAEMVGAELPGALLIGANLEQANLSSTVMAGADLTGVEATTCELEGAVLDGAVLRDAVLIRCNLSLASLVGADLRGAHLEDSHLVGADLSGADLRGADLCRVDFAEATLDDALLEGAVYTSETRWPEGFVPEGATLKLG